MKSLVDARFCVGAIDRINRYGYDIFDDPVMKQSECQDVSLIAAEYDWTAISFGLNGDKDGNSDHFLARCV